jgi:fimbrial chaperone protein
VLKSVAALAALLCAVSATAGSFSLAPLGLSIPPRESSRSVVAINSGDEPIVIQVKTLAWSQRDGVDVREESRDLIANPPIFKLAPGEQQLVRFASRSGPPRDVEATYRAVFSEVLPKDAPQGGSGFRLTLAMDIPVYIEPVVPASSVPIRWRADHSGSGIRLTAENPGNVHFRIVDSRFFADGALLRAHGILAVLPRSRSVIDLPAPPRGATAIQVMAQDSAGQPVSVDIALPPAN